MALWPLLSSLIVPKVPHSTAKTKYEVQFVNFNQVITMIMIMIMIMMMIMIIIMIMIMIMIMIIS